MFTAINVFMVYIVVVNMKVLVLVYIMRYIVYDAKRIAANICLHLLRCYSPPCSAEIKRSGAILPSLNTS